MTNIIKYAYFVFLFTFFTTDNLGQILLNTNIELNQGGYINDIANINTYNTNEQYYLLAGNFSTINGHPSNGLQFISKTTLYPVEPQRFSNITDASFTGGQITEIKTVSYYKKKVTYFGIKTTYEYIFIGGTFQQVNGDSHVGFCLFRSINNSNFVLNSWDPDFATGMSFLVESSIISNDTLFISGDFDFTETTGTSLHDITAFTLPDLASTNFGQNYYNNGSVVKLHLVKDKIIAYSQGHDRYLINNGDTVLPFLDHLQGIYNFFGAVKYTDTTFISPLSFSQSGPIHLAYMGYTIYEYNSENAHSIDTIYNPNAPSPLPSAKPIFYSPYQDELYVSSINRYKDYFYFLGKLRHYNSSPTNVTPCIWKRKLNDSTNIIIDTISYSNTFGTQGVYQESFIYDNKLFYCPSFIDSIRNQPFNGLAIYCLEPGEVKLLIEGDSLACAGKDSLVYTIAPVDNAAKYIWKYTGNGCRETSSNNPLSTNDSVITNSPSITIGFDNNFTPGQLKVTPVSDCNLTSNTFIINIGSYPIPNAFAGIDTTLNCIRDTVVLIGSSSSSNITMEWLNSPFPSIIGAMDTVVDAGQYVFQVTDSLGCYNFDTVAVTLDTVKPVANTIPTPYDLTCAVTSRVFTGSSVNSSDSLAWRYNGNLYSNPITVSAIGTYRLIVTDRINGCADSSQAAIVNLDNTPPDLGILNYPNYSPITYLETITCANDSIELITTSTNIDAVTNWTNADSSLLFGDSITITTGGTYYITAVDTLNGCSIYKQVLIDSDTTKPDVILPLSPNLTCSLDSVTLNGSTSVSPATLEWTGASISPSANPVVVNTQGTYYLTVTKDSSGCLLTDSVSVGFIPEISVFAGNDTTVCDNATISLNVQYLGNAITGVNYLWDNASTTVSANYIGGVSPYAVVEVFGDNSCYGTDTVFINIPPEPTSDFQSFQPCASDTDGKIIANVFGGWAPFVYSIDNGVTFQNSPIFSNLISGTYPITVRDSLGCDYNFTETIDANSNLPNPLFLVSTYNFVSDTVVLVDVSTPPADSTSWIFPSEVEVLDSNTLSPVIILPDTGNFEITMTAYFGSCNISISKWVNSAEFDSTFANYTNQNGIKSVVLYPNPNDGNFNLNIEFFKKQQAVVTIQDISGNTYVNNQYFEVDAINEYIQLNSPVTGTYILKVVSEYDSGYITFVINN